MKRTTLLLDAPLYAELKRRAAAEGRTLTEIVEVALRLGLAAPARHARVALPSYDLGPFLADPADRGAAPGIAPMIAVDVSVLAYAVNRYVPEHPRATAVLEGLVNGDAPWAIPTSVLHEFVDLVTRPHASVRPLQPGDAAAFVERLLAGPSVRLLGATPRHATVLLELLQTVEVIGGLPPGLETAVLLREHGLRELLSADRGMGRFPFLTVIDPVHGEPWTPGAPPSRRYRVLKARSVET